VLVAKKQDAEKSITQARTKSKSEVNRIISQSEKRVCQQQRSISRQLQEQNVRLEERIHKRKTMSNRSVNSDRDEFDN
jgi:F0F1-type ATP synthase membrane subunit b/b'